MRVFLSFNSQDQRLAEALQAGLIAADRAVEVFFSPISLGAGFWLPKLATGIAEADVFLLLIGEKGVGPWQEIEYHEAFDRHVQNPTFTLVPVMVGEARAFGLPFLRRLNWVELPAITAGEVESRVLPALRGETTPERTPRWKLVEPYRGLEAMTETSADYFFGRAAETCAVLDLLAAKPERLPLLIGASGVGKSSIARAGVLSSLKAMCWPSACGAGCADAAGERSWPRAFAESRRTWAWLVMRPGGDPLTALAGAFVRLWFRDATDPERAARTRGWAESLAAGNRLSDLIDATQDHLAERDGAAPSKVLVYLDQAEELYTRPSDTAGRTFSKVLAEGMADPRLVAFGSLRADHFGHLQADRPLFECHEVVNVPPLGRAELTETVCTPAAMLGVTLEDDCLAERIVDSALSEPGQLPLLSYMMTDMWSAMVRKGEPVLRLPSTAINVGGVLAARAEQFLIENKDKEVALKRLLTLRLTVVPAEGAPARRSARQGECSSEEWALAEVLADYPWRLVVANRRHSDDEPMLELAHEALLRAWPRFEGWLRDEREFLVFKTEVERAERRWQAMNAPPIALLTGLDLNRAESWLAVRPGDLTNSARSFIRTSIEADRAAKEKAARFQHRVMIGAVAAAVLMAGVSGVAVWQTVAATRSAEQNVKLANKVIDLLSDRLELPRSITNTGFVVAAASADTASADMEKLALEGNSAAMTAMGLMYSSGKGKEQNYERARMWYEQAAAGGNAVAMRSFGIFYHNGLGVQTNNNKAREWLEKAAARGDTDAMSGLGFILANGEGVPIDYSKAKEWYEKAAANGNTIALGSLGVLYDYGQGVPQDHGKARELYEKAMAGGNTSAMYNLGVLYDYGQGVPQDYGKARELYEKAAAGGDTDAMFNLGLLYDNGHGVPQEYGKAREWYEKAADGGNSKAMNNLGLLYDHGQGGPQEYGKAREWYEKAATGGDASAMFNLGLLYDNGQGVPQDYGRALEWYEKAATGGNTSAMFNLGLLYDIGRGVPQDLGKAREWYEKAADGGDADAMKSIGNLYYNGEGVPQDYAHAREWYEKAAACGNTGAMNNLSALYAYGQGVPQDYAKALEWAEKSQNDTLISWFGLFNRRFDEALAAATRAHAANPESLVPETNRAHTLMFLGRLDEAKAIYFAHKDEMVAENNVFWQDAIENDFVEFRKADLTSPLMAEVEAALGVKGQ
jgi:TPR repeat protein